MIPIRIGEQMALLLFCCKTYSYNTRRHLPLLIIMYKYHCMGGVRACVMCARERVLVCIGYSSMFCMSYTLAVCCCIVCLYTHFTACLVTVKFQYGVKCQMHTARWLEPVFRPRVFCVENHSDQHTGSNRRETKTIYIDFCREHSKTRKKITLTSSKPKRKILYSHRVTVVCARWYIISRTCLAKR